ncbi:hypothetical protein H1D32_12135 [Anaerobacillus sp. CMMVII]|uniref:hypothetical protein n=1 Tax=Anaerobacillus sp. CMMVII TaxID=2755588 RepID=UPI0021B719F8|nr:hypothetical protein [Anaerobacillus sp. CMMVII]MCT8138426.1 hypothetical protein [Anaerobacillus sp. CMMVII]
MGKHILTIVFLVLMLSLNPNKTNASERVVLLSIPSEVWHQNVYLLADKKSWMEYENFTVQIGDRGENIYNFPNWYHGKYDPALYKEDINGDSLEDVIVVLNNYRAGIGNPLKDIHILNQIHDPYRRYYEAKIDPIRMAIKQNVKIEKNDNLVNIYIEEETFTIDITKCNFKNPRNPFFGFELTEYNIENGLLIATVPAYVLRDDSVLGGYIGHLKVQYNWDGQAYIVKEIAFIKFTPEYNKHFITLY